MNKIIDELERECRHLDTQREKYENDYPTIAKCFKNAKTEIWKAINYEIVKEENENKKVTQKEAEIFYETMNQKEQK